MTAPRGVLHAKSRRTFTRMTVPEHARAARPATQPSPEEQALAVADPPVPAYAAALKARSAGRGTLALRRLLALSREYRARPSSGRHHRRAARPL
jgi:hypothetical protein